MNEQIDGRLVPRLQELYREGGAAKALLDWAAARAHDAAETTIDRLISKLQVSRSEAVDLAHRLSDVGCGGFIVGRRGGKSRIRWAYSLRSLGHAAQGRTTELADIDPEVLEDAAYQEPPMAVEVPPDRGLTIADAKRRLATTLGVAPEAIEITIRA